MTDAPREHPILFNGPMVRAILDGQDYAATITFAEDVLSRRHGDDLPEAK